MSSDAASARSATAALDSIDFEEAAARIAPHVMRTPLLRLPCNDPRIDLRGKMENRQVTGSFKARGACNNIACLTEEARAGGVVASSSGNHGRALAWAAGVAGVPATIVMPQNAYPNKIEACRAEGAEVVLAEDRLDADVVTARIAAEGRTLIHPYDLLGTIEGAGTVGWELAQDWPDVEVVLVCVGGGGLSSGTSLALRRALGDSVRIYGVEPIGSPSMREGLAAGEPVVLKEITTEVQGLCPPSSGALNIAICSATLDGVFTPDDATILAAQRRLVNDEPGWGAEVVEPAGACAYSAVLADMLPAELLANRTRENPVRVAVTISGGNPDPAQLAGMRADEE